MSGGIILHSDLNAFYASAEINEHPELKGKKVAVCGSTENRHGIVLTASYPAKRAGVKTGMANWEAKEVCRDLIVVEPHYDLYLHYSRLVRRIYHRYAADMFFLMEKQDTSDRGSAIVTSKDGDIICDNCQNGLDASVIDQIKSFLHPVQPAIAVEHPKPHGRPKLENYQKYLENGEYLRSSSPENTEEQNYNMIDGVGNNKKTRKRVSVRKRLREKQQLLHGGIEKQRLLEKA